MQTKEKRAENSFQSAQIQSTEAIKGEKDEKVQ